MATLLAPGTLLHSRYAVEQVAQVGNRGALYLGTDAQAAAKTVAIRETFDNTPEEQAHAQAEAALLTGLTHPALPALIDSFAEPSGRYYLVLEHIEGSSLEDILARDGAQAEDKVLSWFDRLLAAVEYLHSQKPPLVHGAISPASITLTPDGAPHLTDLAGVDNPPEPGVPLSSSVSAFFAPEQYLGRTDERSDIYALGATLFALLTGKTPPSALARAAGEALPAPRQLNASITPTTEAAILKALALELPRRFGTVAEFWRAFQRPTPSKRSPVVAVLLVGGSAILCLVLAIAVFWRVIWPVVQERVPVAGLLATPTSVPVLATVGSAPTATARPTIVIPTPVPTQAPSEAPSQAPSSTPTLEPAATATMTRTPPAGPSATRTVTGAAPRTTVTPLPSATTAATVRHFPAPVLLWPSDGAIINGLVEFQWYWNEGLASDERFDLQVWALGTDPAGIAWTRDPLYRTTSLPGSGGNYRWRVRVVRVSGDQVQGAVTDFSSTQALEWHASDSDTAGPSGPVATATAPAIPATAVPPTAAPATPVPPTAVPATAVPPTAIPPTAVPTQPPAPTATSGPTAYPWPTAIPATPAPTSAATSYP